MHNETERDRRRDGRCTPGQPEAQDNRAGLLRGLLRRIVGPRDPNVYVMEPDGRMRRA